MRRHAPSIGTLMLVLVTVLAACMIGGRHPARAHGHAEPATTNDDAFTDEISYSNDIRPVIRNFCTTCHSGLDPDGGFVLTGYDAVREHVEHGDVLARIDDPDDPMPPSGLLPLHMRRMIRVWADQGYINEGTRPRSTDTDLEEYVRPTITPFVIDARGFEFLERMQGHWVGSLWLMGQSYPWFAFDYRAIAPSHVHGIFEGGTIGNLFTSFFVVRYQGRRTLMARNGGILNGTYRTSYFLLDSVEDRDGATSYRFVDALGGADIMWMEITFRGDEIEFTSATSRLGLIAPPNRHMRFTGTRKHPELAAAAAAAVGFPKMEIELDLHDGLPLPDWGASVPVTSASYIWEDRQKRYAELGVLAKDPYRIEEIPHLAQLTVAVRRDPAARRVKLLVYLSQEPLTDARGRLVTEHGYLRADLADGLLMFPEIAASQDQMTFTYLHPGEYHLTVIADMDGDGFPSPGDIARPSRRVLVEPESHARVDVDGPRARE